MNKKITALTGVIVTLTASALLLNCSAASTSTNTTITTSGLSSFAAGLAEEMVLTSPTAQRSGGSIYSTGVRYSKIGDVTVLSAPAPEDSPKEKKDALEELLASTAPVTCAISINLQNSGRANCYGPSVNFTDHEVNGVSDGSWPGGDLGIWEDSETPSGEACVAAQLNMQMKGAISLVDAAQFIAAGMACVANKNGDTFPATEGSSLDLTADMSGVVTINSTAVTVTTAEISRETNDGSGNPVYVTTLSGTAGTKTYSIRVKHVSTSTDDSTNKGKISVTVSDSGGMAYTDGASLAYEKTSATNGVLELKKVNYNGAGASPYVSGTDYTVNYAGGWAGNADYLLAQIDPTKFTGTFAYAWQAGNGDSHTRVFNAILSESGGAVTGSAFFGFGPTMQSGPGAISGMICNWTGPDNPNHVPVSKVQRQDLALTSGKFVVSGTTHTTFDPVANCEANTRVSAPTTTMVMDWNSGMNTRSVSNTTENLSPLADVASALTLPTPPANVD